MLSSLHLEHGSGSHSHSKVGLSSRSHCFFQEDSTLLSKCCPTCDGVAGFSQAFKASVLALHHHFLFLPLECKPQEDSDPAE